MTSYSAAFLLPVSIKEKVQLSLSENVLCNGKCKQIMLKCSLRFDALLQLSAPREIDHLHDEFLDCELRKRNSSTNWLLSVKREQRILLR